MNHKLGLVVSICASMIGVSVILFGISISSVTAKQPEAPETSIVVNTLNDELNSDGDCSLREAIQAANDNVPVDACATGNGVITDTITFDVAGVILLNTQLGVLSGGPLHINGGGAITVSGDDSVRVFYINTGAEVTLSNLTISDGYVNAGTIGGGGILNFGGTLTIINSTLSDNSVGSVGGGGGGGIFNQIGTLTIINSTLSNNSAAHFGGGIACVGDMLNIINSTISGNTSGRGGGIYNNRTMIIKSSTLSGNSSTENGGGIYHAYGDLTIINSTLSNNAAISGGGGISTYGGKLTISNSTLSGNSSGNGGGIYNENDGAVTISSSTLSGNSAEIDGGGIYNMSSLDNQVIVGGSIVANSPSGGNCAGTLITDGGYNLENTDTCSFNQANGSLPNTNPLLGPLQDNGGPTLTHALLKDSPATDMGDPVNCPPTDQRGLPRPTDGDHDGIPACDIGSYEMDELISGLVASSDSPTLLGSFTSFTAIVETGTNISYAWDFGDEAAGEGATLKHIYTALGVYTATVTASNNVGSVYASAVVNVVIPKARVFMPAIMRNVQSNRYKEMTNPWSQHIIRAELEYTSLLADKETEIWHTGFNTKKDINQHQIYLPVIIACKAPSQPLTNGGFELGVTDWIFSPPDMSSVVNSWDEIVPHSGNWMAHLSGAIPGIYPSLGQAFSVPECSHYLSFWWSAKSGCGGVVGDRCNSGITLTIDDVVLALIEGKPDQPWQRVVVDLGAYEGKIITLRFVNSNDRVGQILPSMTYHFNPPLNINIDFLTVIRNKQANYEYTCLNEERSVLLSEHIKIAEK